MAEAIAIKPEKDAGTDVVTYSVTDGTIADLRVKYKDIKPITNAAGYREVKSAIAVIRGHRTDVEKRRKELKADALAWGRKVDAEAKRITTELESIEGRLKQIKADEDQRREEKKREAERKAEEARQATLDKIDELLGDGRLADLSGKPDAYLKARYTELQEVDIDAEDFGEFLGHALKVRQNSINTIVDDLAKRAEARRQAEQEKQIRKQQAELDRQLEEMAEIRRQKEAAEAEQLRLKKEAEAEQLRLKKEAEAEQLRLKKEAEAEQLRLKKEAEAAKARLQESEDRRMREMDEMRQREIQDAEDERQRKESGNRGLADLEGGGLDLLETQETIKVERINELIADSNVLLQVDGILGRCIGALEVVARMNMHIVTAELLREVMVSLHKVRDEFNAETKIVIFDEAGNDG